MLSLIGAIKQTSHRCIPIPRSRDGRMQGTGLIFWNIPDLFCVLAAL